MLISVLIACATAPINMLVDFLFHDIISAPLADEFKVELQNRLLKQRVGDRVAQVRQATGDVVRQSISLARGAFSIGPSSEVHPEREKLRRSFSARMSSTVIDTFAVPDAMTRKLPPAVVRSHVSTSFVLKDVFESQRARSESYDSAENGLSRNADMNLFDSFSDKLFKQCDCLNGNAKQDFVARWGLMESSASSHGARYPSLDIASGISANARRFLHGCSRRDITRQEIHSRAMEDSKRILEQKMSKLRLASDIQVGLEVMHLFIIDLLG